MYVEVTVTEPEDFFLLRLNKCWATQTPQPNSSEELVHTLLLNGLTFQYVQFVYVVLC